MNYGEDIALSGSRSPYSDNSDGTDVVDVLDDDNNDDIIDTDHSNVIDDTQQVNDDETDEDNVVADAPSKTKIISKLQQKRLVISKTSRIISMPQTSTNSSYSKNDGTKSLTTTSPIRIKLSLKKLPISSSSNSKRLDANTVVMSSKRNENTDNKSTAVRKTVKKVDNVSRNGSGDDQIPPVTKVVDDQNADVNTGTSMVGTPAKNSSKGDSATKVENTLTGKTKSQVQKSLPIVSKAATGTASKRRSLLPSKQVRIPPITSPGLSMLRPPIPIPPPPMQSTAQAPTQTGKPTYYTPQQVFDVVMTGAGYTYEQRTDHPHRGSSVQRTISDMFDTNTILSLHPMELIPKDLWNYVPPGSSETSTSVMMESTTSSPNNESLPYLLIRALEKSKEIELQNRKQEQVNSIGTRKRPRPNTQPMALHEMVPVSLTLPCPEWYIQKRVEYVNMVKQREDAIIQWQDAQEEIEMAGDENDVSDAEIGPRNSSSNPITIPPIPQLPDPPKLHELGIPPAIPFEEGSGAMSRRSNLIISNLDVGTKDRNIASHDESMHPIYLPRSKEYLVSHLDPNCFHITDGRYFGLQTNLLADPNFIGPNTPGLTGITNTGGLATATTSTTTSTSGLTGGGMTMILSASYHSAAAVAPTNLKDENSNISSNKVPQPLRTELVAVESNASNGNVLDTPMSVIPSISSPVDVPSTEQLTESNDVISKTPTSRSLSDLRKIMEGDDTVLLESFREWIIRAIVHAHRSRKPANIPFHGPNQETYPDIGKAFAWFGGIKPCDRCKSNKQGVLHCRIRRRHDDPDYDGGHSSNSLLLPLLDAPIETILL